MNLVAGWNLLGNGFSSSIDVASAFGDTAKVVTVWKWVPNTARWAFYAPSLAAQQLIDYAAGKGYDVLTSINGGEGFWVNAKATYTTQWPAGTAFSSALFQTGLVTGWNLIAAGDSPTPADFNNTINVTTLWAWDAARANWYFYAPSLEAKGGTVLADYIAGKGYLDFDTKVLDPITGFWVNKP